MNISVKKIQEKTFYHICLRHSSTEQLDAVTQEHFILTEQCVLPIPDVTLQESAAQYTVLRHTLLVGGTVIPDQFKTLISYSTLISSPSVSSDACSILTTLLGFLHPLHLQSRQGL